MAQIQGPGTGLNLIARGTGANVDVLQAVANRTEGSGIIEVTLDTRIEIPWSPDIHLGGLVKAGLAAFQSTIKAIPGVHLDRDITWTQHDGFGVLRIEARNNPLPVILGPIVAVLLPWLTGLGIILGLSIIAWKLFGAPVKSGVKSVTQPGADSEVNSVAIQQLNQASTQTHSATKSGTSVILIILAGIFVAFLFSSGKGL